MKYTHDQETTEKEKFDPSLPTAFRIAGLFGLPIEAVFLYNPATD